MKLILTSFPELKTREEDEDYAIPFFSTYAWHTDSVIKELWLMADNELEKIEY